MRISLFEVWKLVQRALEGVDVPDGHDREGAFAVQWLAERGFPGLDMFDAASPKMASLWGLGISGSTELQALGTPLLSSGADVVDFCAAAAQVSENGKADIVVRNGRGPILLLPFAARRCMNAGACHFQWEGSDGLLFSVVVAGPETVWIDCFSEIMPDSFQGLLDMDSCVDITITFDRDGADLRAEDGAPDGRLLSPVELKERRSTCLANGIEIEQALWNRMQSLACAVLVPATKHSRELGAGGGNAND